MITWKCDQCGYEESKQPIIGSEFDYHKFGFGSLAVGVDGKQDLCKPCMKKAQDAFLKFDRERTTSKWDAVKRALGA